MPAPNKPERKPAFRVVDDTYASGTEPPGGDMEARITRLEGKMDRVDDRLGRVEDRLDRVEIRLDRVDDRLGKVETGLAVLTERVSHLPQKGFIVTSLLTGLALFSAVVLFADRIRTAFGM